MMMEETLRDIEKNTGIHPNEIADMDWDEIDRHIEQRIGKKLTYNRCNDPRLSNRGSVFLMLGRLIDPVAIAKRIYWMR